MGVKTLFEDVETQCDEAADALVDELQALDGEYDQLTTDLEDVLTENVNDRRNLMPSLRCPLETPSL